MLFYAMDPETGRIDMDLIISGRSSAQREALRVLKDKILVLVRSKSMKIQKLLENIGETYSNIEEALKELESEEVVTVDWTGRCSRKR